MCFRIFIGSPSISLPNDVQGELISRLMNDVGVIQSLLTETPMDALKHLGNDYRRCGVSFDNELASVCIDSHSSTLAGD